MDIEPQLCLNVMENVNKTVPWSCKRYDSLYKMYECMHQLLKQI